MHVCVYTVLFQCWCSTLFFSLLVVMMKCRKCSLVVTRLTGELHVSPKLLYSGKDSQSCYLASSTIHITTAEGKLLTGASKSRNEIKHETKWNGSCAHNNCKFAPLGAIVWPYSYLGLICVSFSIVNQVRLYIVVYVLLLLWFLEGGKLIILFSQRAASGAVCLSSKLDPIVHAPSHTQRGYISLTSLRLLRLGASHTGQEKNYTCAVMRLRRSSNLWVWLPFRFISHFVSRFTSTQLLTTRWTHCRAL